jgi:hypothetical protein
VGDAEELATPIAQHPQLATVVTKALRLAWPDIVESELWPEVHKDHVTWKQMAEGCMWGLFKSLELKVRVAGAWLAHAPAASQRALRNQQAAGNYNMGLVQKWWDDLSNAHRVEYGNSREAAVALFTNPPVAYSRGQLAGACMTIRASGHHHIHRGRKGGYPELVLQRLVPGRLQKVSVPCHQLVACIFLGMPADRDQDFVCHNDDPPPYPATPDEWPVKWEPGLEQPPADVAPGSSLYPRLSMCSDKNCVNPLCLHYGDMASNCRTAHRRHMKVCKKARMKWEVRVTVPVKPPRQ